MMSECNQCGAAVVTQNYSSELLTSQHDLVDVGAEEEQSDLPIFNASTEESQLETTRNRLLIELQNLLSEVRYESTSKKDMTVDEIVVKTRVQFRISSSRAVCANQLIM